MCVTFSGTGATADNATKETIYPEIDKFISCAQIVLAEQLGLDYRIFCLEEAEAKFVEGKATMDAEVVDWIGDMLQDIRYLLTMKQLESPQEGQEKTLDIVPVTGLIVGRFYRIENELRTVVDHWGDHFPAEDETEGREHEEGALEDKRVIEMVASEEAMSQEREKECQNEPISSNGDPAGWVESLRVPRNRSLTDSLKSRTPPSAPNSDESKGQPRNKERASSCLQKPLSHSCIIYPQ